MWDNEREWACLIYVVSDGLLLLFRYLWWIDNDVQKEMKWFMTFEMKRNEKKRNGVNGGN